MIEGVQANGLISGHAYSVTNVAMVTIIKSVTSVAMVNKAVYTTAPVAGGGQGQ